MAERNRKDTKARILIVEDEGITAMDLKMRLTNLGYEVVGIADTGEGAIALADEKRPDLILMDIMLKGEMDGIQAAEHIKPALGIPVIFLTAYADNTTLRRAKVTEPYGYILKPFEERELHTNIQVALFKHEAEELQRREARAEVFSLLASALPVFANGVPPHTRNMLVRTFADRFDRNMRQRFDATLERMRGSPYSKALRVPGTDLALDAFFNWLDELYHGLGSHAERAGGGSRPAVRLPQCPWLEEAKGNPIFCNICRAMVTRAFTWTGLGGNVIAVDTIANGANACTFRITLTGDHHR